MSKYLLISVLFLSFAPLLIFGQTNSQKTVNKTDSVFYSVKGMSCNSCVAHVKGTMDKVNGVTQCDVNLKEGMSVIKYDPSKTDKKKIEEALKSTGYGITELEKKEEKEPKKNH